MACLQIYYLFQGSLTEGGKRLSTVDLLALTRLDQLLFYILNIIYLFLQNKLP